MSVISTASFRGNMASSFIEQMGGEGNSLYICLSQQTPWSTEPFPPDPVDSVSNYKTIWDNVLGMELITLNNMQLVIPTNFWVSGNVYTAYIDTGVSLNLQPNKMYIINSNNEVFKCLSNNSGGPSIQTPFGLGSIANNYIQTLADKYTWKYMYQVAVGDQFFNSQWMPTYQIAPVNSTQYTIEQAATPGAIDFINVINGGFNYINSPQSYIVNILGDGTGANCYANVSGGAIQNIVMADTGQNYTYANCVISDLTGSGGVAIPVMSPFGGNGSDAATELGSTSVMISINTIGDGEGFLSSNVQFRQSALILNPLEFGSNTAISSNTFLVPYTSVNLTGGVGTYANNEVVYQGTSVATFTFVATIVDFNPVTGVMRLNNTKGVPQTGVILYGAQTNAQRYIININNPNVQKYTGEILYIDNEPPIQRTPIQSEFFQYIAQF